MDGLNALDPHWTWLAIGLVLAAAEMAVPGVFLIWMAGAAIITGALTWLVPGFALAAQVVTFALLAILFVFVGKRWLRSNPIAGADPAMNDRGARLLGEVVIVTHAIDSGGGRVKQGDGEWLAKGPDAEPGTRMRVCGNEGVVLIVEHLH